jgi:membrane protease YdiL (CAAX protease family)
VNITEDSQRENFVSFNEAMPLTPPPQSNFSKPNIDPDNPHWNFLSAIGIFVMSVVLIVLFGVLAIASYSAYSGVTLSAENLTRDPVAIISNLIAIFPAHLLTILLAWLLVTRGGRQPFFQTIGWKWSQNFGFWACLAVTFGLYVASVVIIVSFGEKENELTKILQSSRSAVYLTALMATFTAPLTEEIVYRGVLYPAFRKNSGAMPAIFIVTILFALVHVPQYYPSYGTILAICLLSLTLTIIRAWTISLLPCVVIHTLFNGVQSVLLIVEPFLEKSLAPTEQPVGFVYWWFVFAQVFSCNSSVV